MTDAVETVKKTADTVKATTEKAQANFQAGAEKAQATFQANAEEVPHEEHEQAGNDAPGEEAAVAAPDDGSNVVSVDFTRKK